MVESVGKFEVDVICHSVDLSSYRICAVSGLQKMNIDTHGSGHPKDRPPHDGHQRSHGAGSVANHGNGGNGGEAKGHKRRRNRRRRPYPLMVSKIKIVHPDCIFRVTVELMFIL